MNTEGQTTSELCLDVHGSDKHNTSNGKEANIEGSCHNQRLETEVQNEAFDFDITLATNP